VFILESRWVGGLVSNVERVGSAILGHSTPSVSILFGTPTAATSTILSISPIFGKIPPAGTDRILQTPKIPGLIPEKSTDNLAPIGGGATSFRPHRL
jgi:hypothetical protein